jgi:trans-2,3-dihydro-3-hydroxyanthranilate isomerase
MPRRYVCVDVFTEVAFEGNPLAVVLDGDGLDSATMQKIATEFNYSETTFVLPPVDSANNARIRIFTPTTEIPFAGHPNVGTAIVLAREWLSQGKPLPQDSTFLFEEIAGVVPVRLDISAESGEVMSAELTAPKPLAVGPTISCEDAALCLGLDAADVETSVHGPTVASVGLPFLLVELKTRAALAQARGAEAEEQHRRILTPAGTDGVYCYYRDRNGNNLHSRMFAPIDKVFEDPATGSATVALVALLASSARARNAHKEDFNFWIRYTFNLYSVRPISM